METMKTLSLVDCVELKFPGNILKEALCFGDVDNDGVNELVVGNTDGELLIFKNDKCVCRAFDLGCISAIAVGDLLNINKNVTVVTTMEGHCHVFDVEEELLATNPILDEEHTAGSSMSSSFTNDNICNEEGQIIQQFHSQRIVANTKVMFLADVNDDDMIELVVGLTDRVVRTYKWNLDPVPELSKAEEISGIKTTSRNNLVFYGRLQAVNKWELAKQIGSIAPHKQGNLTSILIGQPGGTVTRITELSTSRETEVCDQNYEASQTIQTSQNIEKKSSGKELPPGDEDHSVLLNPILSDNISIKYHTLSSSETRNVNISTDIAGNIASFDGQFDNYAVTTWDGNFMFCKDDVVEWSFKVDQPLLTVQSFQGSAIFVDWGGPTYLLNRRLDPSVENCILRFYFEDHVAAFRVGQYGMRRHDLNPKSKATNLNCLAYVTFHGSIYIYPNEYL